MALERLCGMTKWAHQLIRNMLQELISEARVIAASANGSVDALQRQAYETSTTIHHHHTIEDQAVFPWYLSCSAGTPFEARVKEMVKKLDGEHAELSKALDELVELSRNKSDSTATLAARIGQSGSRIQDFLLPHLQYEEDNFTPDFLGSFVKPADLQRFMRRIG